MGGILHLFHLSEAFYNLGETQTNVKARVNVTASVTPLLTQEWPEPGQWTYDDWARLPSDGNKYEVINGVLYVTPAPAVAHQFTSGDLFYLMADHANDNDLGYVLAAPVDVLLPNQPVPLQPDILFLRKERKGIVGQQNVEGAPDLIVEILSPSNTSYDRQTKFAVYEDAGVPEYWIVDYRARTIEVFVLEDEYVLLGKWGMGETAISRALEGFQVPVSRIFRNL
jgi:Uma2 family endonuclease